MQIHHVDNAPRAIGPYCHVVQTGNLVFCSGQTPLDLETLEIVSADIGEQTEHPLNISRSFSMDWSSLYKLWSNLLFISKI